jgi:hypothetical protein
MRRPAITVVCLIMTLSTASAQTSWPDQRPKTHGHFTYMQAALWKGHLADLVQPQQ